MAEEERKCVRIRSGDDNGASDVAVRECTILDILTEIKKLATKDDIAQLKGSLVAPSAEIEQLRSEVSKHHDRIKTLEERASMEAIEQESRTPPEVMGARSKQHGGAHATPGNDIQTRRRSVIFHGLNNVKDEDLMESILDTCHSP